MPATPSWQEAVVSQMGDCSVSLPILFISLESFEV